MEYGDESGLVEERPKLTFGPKPTREVSRCQEGNTSGRFSQSSIHLERLTLARLNGDCVEPDPDATVLKCLGESARDVLSIDPGVAEEDVVLPAVLEVDCFMDPLD